MSPSNVNDGIGAGASDVGPLFQSARLLTSAEAAASHERTFVTCSASTSSASRICASACLSPKGTITRASGSQLS